MIYPPYRPNFPDFPDPRATAGLPRGWYPYPYDMDIWPDAGEVNRGLSRGVRTRGGGCGGDGGFGGFGGRGVSEGPLTPDDFSGAAASGAGTGNGTATVAEPPVVQELRRCATGLKGLAPSLDNIASSGQAQVAAVSYFFYSLGLLFTQGVTIPRDIPVPGSSNGNATTRGGACRDFGDAIDKFIDKYTRGLGRDIGDLIDKGKDCWDHLSK